MVTVVRDVFFSFTACICQTQVVARSKNIVIITGLITRTLGPSNDFTMLNGCTGKCVRLS